MITAFLQFFGRILLWLYNTCGSYALSLALFTLMIKVILFPLSYKGKKGMMQMSSLNAEMQRLQKQYGKDQQRYQLEVQKLYEEEHVNPMGGCLWSLLPFPILIGLYAVIREPMLHMLCLTTDQVNAVADALAAVDPAYTLTQAQQSFREIILMNWIGQDPALFDAAAAALGDAADKLQEIDFNFIGINLGATPNWQFWTWDSYNWGTIGLFLIPIVVTVLNFLYSMYSMKSNQIQNSAAASDDNPAAKSTKTMMYLMPLMYLWFGYAMPAGMCIYMAVNAIFGALENLLYSKVINKKFAAEEEIRQARLAEKRNAEKAKKAEIAARRAAEEEELKKKGGKKALKQAQKKAASRDSGAGQIGVRKYARGRSYDPERYPTTVYRDPQDVLDEEALERALAKRGKLPKQQEEPPVQASEDSAKNETNEPNEQ